MKIESADKVFQFTVAKDLIKQAVGDGPEFEILYEAILNQIEANTPKQTTEGNTENVETEENTQNDYEPINIGSGATIDAIPMRLKGEAAIMSKKSPLDIDYIKDSNIKDNNSSSNSSGNISSSNKTEELNKLPEYSDSEKMEKIYSAIEKYAPQYDVDPNLVLAIIKTESNFNPNASSHAGAKGLMQLMDFNSEAYGISNPYDIEENIRGGITHLRSYLNMYDNNLEMALMAYNGGPGNMERRGVKSPSDLYKMPQETQNYVPKVLKYYNDYKNR